MNKQSEPAPAQDEREALVVVGYAYNLESGAYSQYPGEDWSALMTVAQHKRIVEALTRPAQTEQQPVAHQYKEKDGNWYPIAPGFIGSAQLSGYEVRPLYASPSRRNSKYLLGVKQRRED